MLSGILSGSKSYGAETMTMAWATSHDGGDPREQTTRYNEDNSWRDEIDEFARAIVDDAPIVNGSVIEALKTMLLVSRIYCADAEWRNRYGLSDSLSESIIEQA